MIPIISTQLTRFAVACQPGDHIRFLKFPTWYQYLDSEKIAGKCTPMIDLAKNPGQITLIVLALIEILLRIAGVVAVGFVIYGGFQFILTQGEPDRAASARNTIINALIGLAIAISATGIVMFVANNLTK
ncbi:MAG: pilin [Candidatus Saccharimonadales bacterium]